MLFSHQLVFLFAGVVQVRGADYSDSEPSLGFPVSLSSASDVELSLGFPPVSPVSQGSVEIELNGRDQGWVVEGSQVDGSGVTRL